MAAGQWLQVRHLLPMCCFRLKDAATDMFARHHSECITHAHLEGSCEFVYSTHPCYTSNATFTRQHARAAATVLASSESSSPGNAKTLSSPGLALRAVAGILGQELLGRTPEWWNVGAEPQWLPNNALTAIEFVVIGHFELKRFQGWNKHKTVRLFPCCTSQPKHVGLLEQPPERQIQLCRLHFDEIAPIQSDLLEWICDK